MAITYIEVDTDSGRHTVERLRGLLAEARTTIGRLGDSMEELNSTWDGVANETMNKRFVADRESIETYCEALGQMIDQMEQAQSCYEAGQNKVDSCIQSFHLER